MSTRQKPLTLSVWQAVIICLSCCLLTYFVTSLAVGKRPSLAAVPNNIEGEPAKQRAEAQPTVPAAQIETPSPYKTVSRVVTANLIKLEDGTQVTLLGIDVPLNEFDETSGREALAFLRGAVEGRKVRVEYEADDFIEKNSSLAYVYLEDGTHLNAQILKRGYAFSSEGDYRLQREFSRYESEAKKNNVGIWYGRNEQASNAKSTDEITDLIDDKYVSNTTTVEEPPEPIATPVPYSPPPRTYPTDTYSSNSEKVETPSAYIPPRPTYKPPVAENGSYYGEMSENTGRPKTVHVNGYYRRDGRYVRGHYRSSPRR